MRDDVVERDGRALKINILLADCGRRRNSQAIIGEIPDPALRVG